jgi:uncharacterized protein YukE
MSAENQPEVHVTVIESQDPNADSAQSTEPVAEALGTAAAVIGMAGALAEQAQPNDNGLLRDLLGAVNEGNSLLRELISKTDRVVDATETTAVAEVLDVVQDAENETETVAEVEKIGETVKEEIEQVADAVQDAPKQRKSRWL